MRPSWRTAALPLLLLVLCLAARLVEARAVHAGHRRRHLLAAEGNNFGSRAPSKNGLRNPDSCGVVRPPEARIDAIEEEVRGWLKNHPEWEAPGNSANSNGANSANGQVQGVKNGQQGRRSLASMVTIRVYWHVITNSIAGDLTKAQVQGQIATMNAAYNQWGFNYVLAGFDRTVNATWFNPASESLMTSYSATYIPLLRKGGAADLNVYSSYPPGLYGSATWPWNYKSSPNKDGIILNYQAIPGGEDPDANEGDTLTHEVGHWLGLFHPWDQTVCSDKYGDRVADTPAQLYDETRVFECVEYDSCPSSPGMDPIHNFMSWTNDACIYYFTAGQATRMQQMFAAYRYGK